MGNQSTGGKRYAQAKAYGDVFVQLDQTSLFSGDTITGTMYLDLRVPFPGDKMCFKFKGTEYAKWMDKEARHRKRHDGTMETYYVDVKRESERYIINQTVDIYDWSYGTVLPAGQFSFPISFKIPSGAPGSFFMHQGTTVAEIRYRMEGFLKPEFATNPKIKYKLDLPIRERVKQQIQTTTINLTKGLKTWCCIDQGSINVNTSFEKNAYAPSEKARVIADIDNSKSQLAIKDIVFELVQRIDLHASGHMKVFNYTIRSSSLGGVQAGQTCVGQQQKFAVLDLPPGQAGNAKLFKKENHQGASPHPSQVLTPSTHGALVKSDFYLNIRCPMDGCICCDNDPTTQLPIQIYAPEMVKLPPPVAPPQWKPQAMPSFSIPINVIIPTTSPQPQPNMMAQPNQTPGQPQMMNSQMPQQGYPQQQQQPHPQPQQPQPQMMNGQMPQQGYPQQQQQQQPQPYPQPQQPQPQMMNSQMPQQGYPQQQQPYNQPQQGYPQPQPGFAQQGY